MDRCMNGIRFDGLRVLGVKSLILMKKDENLLMRVM